MAKKKTQRILKKPFDKIDFVEITENQIQKELSENEIEFLDNTKKIKTNHAIYKIEK